MKGANTAPIHSRAKTTCQELLLLALLPLLPDDQKEATGERLDARSCHPAWVDQSEVERETAL